MITPEKMFEMMNPSKAYEAMSQGKIFDADAQRKLFENANDQTFGLISACQAQTRKVMDFWLDQSEAAIKEGQKFVKQWCATISKANAEIVSEVETTVKDAAKVFELPKSAKAVKTA